MDDTSLTVAPPSDGRARNAAVEPDARTQTDETGTDAGETGAGAGGGEIAEVPFGDVLESRAAVYETLSSLFFLPLSQGQVDEMAAQDLAAFGSFNEDFDAGINDVTRYLRKRNTGTRQELACDFTSSFGGTKTYNGLSAVPYESVFTSEDGLLCQGAYQEVFATYKRESLRRREGLDFPEDHLSFMCQFMAVMSRRACERLSVEDYAGALDDVEISLDFLNDHILSWYDAFAERAALLIKTRFYRGVLKIGKGFFAFDRETLEGLAEDIGRCV